MCYYGGWCRYSLLAREPSEQAEAVSRHLRYGKVLPTYDIRAICTPHTYREFSCGNQCPIQGFGVGAGYTNVNNQLIILGSYDLIGRTVDSLPFMNVEYITKGRFKTRNIYRNSPISVEYTKIDPTGYQHLFRCTVQEDGSLLINTFDENFPFSYVTHYGEELETSLFTARIWPTNMMMHPGQHIYFRFRSRESLTDEFSSRLQLNFITERSTVLGIQLVGETPERDREFIDKLSDIYLFVFNVIEVSSLKSELLLESLSP